MSENTKTGMKILYKHPLLTILEYKNEVFMRTYDFVRERVEYTKIDEENGAMILFFFEQQSDIEFLEKLFLEVCGED